MHNPELHRLPLHFHHLKQGVLPLLEEQMPEAPCRVRPDHRERQGDSAIACPGAVQDELTELTLQNSLGHVCKPT